MENIDIINKCIVCDHREECINGSYTCNDGVDDAVAEDITADDINKKACETCEGCDNCREDCDGCHNEQTFEWVDENEDSEREADSGVETGATDSVDSAASDSSSSSAVYSPSHYVYGGIETIDFIEAKELPFHLGNVVKYISRAGHKGGDDSAKQDIMKAKYYLDRYICATFGAEVAAECFYKELDCLVKWINQAEEKEVEEEEEK